MSAPGTGNEASWSSTSRLVTTVATDIRDRRPVSAASSPVSRWYVSHGPCDEGRARSARSPSAGLSSPRTLGSASTSATRTTPSVCARYRWARTRSASLTDSPIGSYRYSSRRLRPRATVSIRARGGPPVVACAQPVRFSSWVSPVWVRRSSTVAYSTLSSPCRAQACSPSTMAAISIVLPDEVPPTRGVCTTRMVPAARGRNCSQCGHSAVSFPRPASRAAGSRCPHRHTCPSTP